MISFPRFSPTVFSVASNTFAQMLGKVATAGTTFLMTIAIARAYGAEGYGDFTKITTYVALFFLFADFGLNAIYLQKADQNSWQALFGLRLAGSTLLIFLAIAILSFLPQSTTQGFTGLVRLGIILYSPAIIFQAILTTANALFQRHLRYGFSTIAVTAGSLVSLILVWVAAGTLSPSAGSLGSVLALGVGSAVTAVAALIFVKKLTQTLSPSFNRRAALSLLKASIPLGATLILNVVYFRIDSIILALTRTTAEVGIYGLAYKFFELPLVLPTFFMNAVYPLMLTSQKLLFMVKRSAIILLITSLLSLITIWVAAPLLPLIKSDFSGSIPALRVLSLGLPFFFLTNLTMWTIIALKKQTTLLFIYGASMVGTIIADVLFIPTFGMMAAAWVTVVSEAAVFLISGTILLRYIREAV